MAIQRPHITLGNQTLREEPDEYLFTNQSSLVIVHTKSYRPSVWITDSSGDVIDAHIRYGEGTITITFCMSLSGVVYVS